MAVDVTVLRELLRNLQAFRALYETEGIDEITAPDGTVWHLLDVESIYEYAMRVPPLDPATGKTVKDESYLSPRQREAISLCLVRNIRERDAALMMGVSETNPVAMYATLGLKKLIELIHSGRVPRFAPGEAA